MGKCAEEKKAKHRQMMKLCHSHLTHNIFLLLYAAFLFWPSICYFDKGQGALRCVFGPVNHQISITENDRIAITYHRPQHRSFRK